MWPLQMSSQPQSKATTCAPTQHQRRGSFDFVEFHDSEWGSRWLCSLISLQDYSISSFLLNFYNYFTKQWRIITIWEKRILFLNFVVSLLCNQFDGEYIYSFSSVNLQLVCEWGTGGPPLLSSHILLLAGVAIWVIAAIAFDASYLNRAIGMW